MEPRINEEADQVCEKDNQGQNERRGAAGVARNFNIEPSYYSIDDELVCDDKLDDQGQENKREGAAEVTRNLNAELDVNQINAIIQGDDLTTRQEGDRKVEVAKLQEEVTKLTKELDRLNVKILLDSSVLHEAENRVLREEVARLKNALKGEEEVFLFRKISEKNKLVAHYTGLLNKETFLALSKLNYLTALLVNIKRGGRLKK